MNWIREQVIPNLSKFKNLVKIKIKDLFNNYTFAIAIILVSIGFFTIIYFIFSPPFNDGSYIRDATLFGQFGDFIGGFIGTLFSLVGYFLIYKTLRAQQVSIKQQDSIILQQKQLFEEQRFETTFFNLLKTQGEIINNLKSHFVTFDNSQSEITRTVIGRDFFIYSKFELSNIWKSLNYNTYLGYIDKEMISNYEYYIEGLYDSSSQDYTHPDQAKEIEKNIKHEHRIKLTNKTFNITNEIWQSFQGKELVDKLNKMYGLFFQRYDYIAGHYFRHLYHILDFAEITESKFLLLKSEVEKKEEILLYFKKYISFIQAQMSSFELMLLFYNAISFPKALRLIIKYNLLENLAIENLIDGTHNCIEGINLKSKKNLIK